MIKVRLEYFLETDEYDCDEAGDFVFKEIELPFAPRVGMAFRWFYTKRESNEPGAPIECGATCMLFVKSCVWVMEGQYLECECVRRKDDGDDIPIEAFRSSGWKPVFEGDSAD